MYLQTIVVIYLFTDSFLDVAIYRSQDYHMITATDQNKQGQHKVWHIPSHKNLTFDFENQLGSRFS